MDVQFNITWPLNVTCTFNEAATAAETVCVPGADFQGEPSFIRSFAFFI